MNDTQLLIDALDLVMIWDPPDDVLPEVLNDQYRLLTGGDPEEAWE